VVCVAEHRLHPPEVHELAELDLSAHRSGELAGPLADLGEQACLQILLRLGGLSIKWANLIIAFQLNLLQQRLHIGRIGVFALL